MASQPLRLMIYDRTCGGPVGLPGLSQAWWTGGGLYRALGRIDRFVGVEDWPTALRWLAEVEPGRPIAEIQTWCHGKWGQVLLDRAPMDATALLAGHPWNGWLRAIRERLVGPEALWWFRTCETFGAQSGHRFARAWTDFFECDAAGHTYIIGAWQSGLHRLGPGQEPPWPTAEGLREGTPGAPRRALRSKPTAPHTITCLHGRVPPGF